MMNNRLVENVWAPYKPFYQIISDMVVLIVFFLVYLIGYVVEIVMRHGPASVEAKHCWLMAVFAGIFKLLIGSIIYFYALQGHNSKAQTLKLFVIRLLLDVFMTYTLFILLYVYK